MNLHFVLEPMPKDGDDSKFKQFHEIYSTETNDAYRPSYTVNLDEINKSLLVKEKAHFLVTCVSCLKPQVTYADAKTFKQEQCIISPHIEVLHYTCGSPLFPEEHKLHSSIVVKLMTSCSDNIEISYYASNNFASICIYCANSENLMDVPEFIKKYYRKVYPLCTSCSIGKKKFLTRMLVAAGKKRKSE